MNRQVGIAAAGLLLVFAAITLLKIDSASDAEQGNAIAPAGVEFRECPYALHESAKPSPDFGKCTGRPPSTGSRDEQNNQ